MKKNLVLIISLTIILSFIGCSSNSTEEPKTEEDSIETVDNNHKDAENETQEVVNEEPKEEPKEEKEEKEDVPREYKSALSQAETYSNVMYMSKSGVYDQLTSEYGGKFPDKAAQYAVDNVKADWKENALKKAETYVNEMSMSDSAVYDQLISEYGEKFTKEEAQYAIDNLN